MFDEAGTIIVSCGIGRSQPPVPVGRAARRYPNNV